MLAGNSFSNRRIGRNVIITSLVARLAGAAKPRNTRLAGPLTLAISAAIGLSAATGVQAAGGTDIWNSTSDTTWLTAGDWTPSGGASTPPGPNDIAEFDAKPNSNINNFGIDFSKTTNNGTANEAVGAIYLSNLHSKTLHIGAISSTSGTLTLNGATVNSIANTILTDFATGGSNLDIQPNTTSSGVMSVALGNTTNVVQVVGGTSPDAVQITSPISEVNTGSSITVLGGGSASVQPGSLVLGVLSANGTNTFTGGVTVGDSAGTANAAILEFDTTGAMPTSGNITINANSQLYLNAAGGTFGGAGQTLTLNGTGGDSANGSGAIRTKGTGTFTYLGSVALGSDTILTPATSGNKLVFSGNVTDNGHQLQKQGAATLELSGTGNVMTGSTLVGNGLLQVDSGSSMGTGSLTLGQTTGNTTAVTLKNAAQTVGTLATTWADTTGTQSQTLTLTGTALTVNQTSAASFDGVSGQSGLTAVITGTGGLMLGSSSTNTLTLGNHSTTFNYSGATAVNGGTLQVNGALASTSGVTVGSGGTLTGGGSINAAAAVTVNGTISASGSGNSSTTTTGTLTTGNQAWDGGGAYNWNINNATGSAGNASGWSFLSMGALDLSSLSPSSQFTIDLNTNGASASNFNNGTVYSWQIASTTGVTGFNASDFILNSTGFSNSHSGTFSLVQSGNALDVDYTPSVAAKNLTWNPPGTAWNTTTANQNWTDTNGAEFFSSGDNVNFTNTGVGSVVVDAGGVQPGSTTVSNTTGTYTFTGGSIGGSGSLLKSGAGMLVISNAANTYGGATTVSGGTLQLGGSNLLPAGTDATVAAGATLDLNGNSQSVNSLSGDTLSTGGNVTLSGGALTISGSINATFAGVISGSGSGSTLTKGGSSTETLAGANTYGGATNINGGKLQLSGGPNVLPTTTSVVLANAAGTSLDINGTTQTIAGLSGGGTSGGSVTIGAGALTVNSSTGNTFGGGISSTTGSLTVEGGGSLAVNGAYGVGGNTILSGDSTLTLGQASGTVNLFTNTSDTPFDGSLIVVNPIRVNFNSADTSGANKSQFTGTNPAADTIQLQASGTTITNVSTTASGGVVGNNVVLNSTVSPTAAAGSFVTYIGGTAGSDSQATAIVFNGVISGASNVTIANGSGGGGAGEIILNAQNTWTGSTSFNAGSTGVVAVQLGTDDALPTTTDVIVVAANGGNLDLNGHNQTIASLSSSSNTKNDIIENLSSGNSVLTINGSSTDPNNAVEYVGSLQEGAGTLGLVVKGTGTTILGTKTGGAGNLYSGGTDVQGGVLQFDNASALTTFGPISVESGGQIVLNSAETYGGATSDTGQALTIAGPGVTGSSGALRTGSGLAVTFLPSVTMTDDTTITVAGATGSLLLSGGLADGGHMLTKQGQGTLTLPSSSSITGSLTVGSGTLDASAIAGGLHFASGQTLSGSGTIDADIHLTAGATLSPGSSPGILGEVGDQTWSGADFYNWQLLDATGAAGVGFDQVAITGTLDVTAASGFDIDLWSLASILPDINGDAADWNNAVTQSWAIVTTTAGIEGFNPANFNILITPNDGSGGFTNDLNGGSFSLSVVDGSTEGSQNLVLTFTPLVTPEPTSFVLLALGGLLIGGRRRGDRVRA